MAPKKNSKKQPLNLKTLCTPSMIYFLVSVDNGVWTSIQTSAMSSNHYVHGSLTYAVS